jgi:short-subunit dehydrogenase
MTLIAKSIVVTGASSGVGRHLAASLNEAGAVLHLIGRSIERLREVRAQCSPSTFVYAADLANDETVSRLGRQLSEQRIDILIHNAGIIKSAPLAQAAIEDLDLQYRINLRAPYVLTQLLLPRLLESRGAVVFINSSTGIASGSGVSQYGATKHALKAVADSLRAEVNPLGVRVMSLYLGRTATPLQEELHRLDNKPYDPQALIQLEAVSAAVMGALNLHPSAEVTDIHMRPMKKSA